MKGVEVADNVGQASSLSNPAKQKQTSFRGVHIPDSLRETPHNLDLAVDRLYRSKPFTSDEERLEHLFKLYEQMTAKEQLV